MTFLFCAYRKWALELHDKLHKKYKNMKLITSPKKLTLTYVKKIKPQYIFFPDWSWKVPEEIIRNFNCICFHESDLPKFRGGSPIQNQIIRGVKKTKTTAFLMNEGIDRGDILLKKNLSLEGNLSDIFIRMQKNDFEMTQKIIQGKYKKRKQTGHATFFKRRTPNESELKTLNHSKDYLYNFIRMLEDPYPNAFIKLGKHTLVFKSVRRQKNKLIITSEIQ